MRARRLHATSLVAGQRADIQSSVGVAHSLGLALKVACSFSLLAACGSGNLGKVANGANVARPDAKAASALLDAGQTSSGTHQGSCGDHIVEPAQGEQCDGDDLAGQSCMNLGLGTGALACDPSTCRVVTMHCTLDAGTGVGMAGDAGPVGAAGNGGAGSAGKNAGTAGSQGGLPRCPTGFSCQAPPAGEPEPVCISLGELTPPLCFTADASAECSPLLPGSSCADTGLGLYCRLPCSP
jgi:hypothetical protein